jgi:hypothetical protein
MDDAWDVAYASGQLLFVRGDTLFAQPFDLESTRLTGRAVALADTVGVSETGAAFFSVSANGLLVHAGVRRLERELTWVDGSGQVIERITTDPAPVALRALSADDRQLLTSRPDPRTSVPTLWLMTGDQQGPLRIGEGGGNRLLSADGRWAVTTTPPPVRIRRIRLEDGRTDWLVENRIAWPTDWSQFDISVLNTETKATQPFLQTPANEGQARFSPEMRWISYVSDDSGQPEVYLRPFGANGREIPISKGGGTQPRWRRDGKELDLYFLSADSHIMAVKIDMRSGKPSGPPTPSFRYWQHRRRSECSGSTTCRKPMETASSFRRLPTGKRLMT